MGKLYQWYLLTLITGNPVLAGLALLVGYWVLDRYTLGVLPDPLRFIVRWQRGGKLGRAIAHNPHDRRARYALADILVSQKRYAAALELLKPNLEAGDDDAGSLFLTGIACLGSGYPEQGELLLTETEQQDPHFRMGEVDLARGKWRLARKDFPGAREALERFCKVRPGTVEGKLLLSLSLDAAGDDVGAAYARQDAWKSYAASPRFQRRRDRWWAYRARPSRPVAYAALMLVFGVLFARFAAPALTQAAQRYARPVTSYRGDVDDDPP